MAVVFTEKGERIPQFVMRVETDDKVHNDRRHGWTRPAPTWVPTFVAIRWGSKHWRLWKLTSPRNITGSISDIQIEADGRSIVHPIRRWPNLASIEMYLRMKR